MPTARSIAERSPRPRRRRSRRARTWRRAAPSSKRSPRSSPRRSGSRRSRSTTASSISAATRSSPRRPSAACAPPSGSISRSALSARVDAALRADRGVLPQAIVRVRREDATLLSFGQERLWFLDQLEPGDPSYILPEVLRFEGALDAGALARALSAIVERHEVLRTTFDVVDGRPVPVVRDADGMPFAVTALRDLPARARAEALRREAALEARIPFDLRTGPMIRARLLELADDDHALLVTMHHIVSDAWSIGVLNRELTALYQAFLAGRPSPLPALPFQYGDYAHWQRSWFTGEALQQALDHVKESLAGIPRALELPTDRPRPQVQSHRGCTLNFALTKELGAALQELSCREGATLFMTLLAAFDVLLHRLTGQSDIVVGSPIA